MQQGSCCAATEDGWDVPERGSACVAECRSGGDPECGIKGRSRLAILVSETAYRDLGLIGRERLSHDVGSP